MHSLVAGRIAAHRDRGQQLMNVEATLWELMGGEGAGDVIGRLRGIAPTVDDFDLGGAIQDEVEREEGAAWYAEHGIDDGDDA